MSITIDICHICLEKKVEFNKLDICNNVDCNGYICNDCWNDIYINDINKCPICYTNIEDINIRENNYSFELDINIKKLSYNILGYLSFYSIGTSCLFIIFLIFFDIHKFLNDINIYYYIISLIFNPILGFIVWYGILISFFKFVEFIKDISDKDNYSDSDSDNDIDIDIYIENMLNI
tara:strand:+ start:466 stop:996 length:531 start_codon:yes stop_codon:yes gene_type:complete